MTSTNFQQQHAEIVQVARGFVMLSRHASSMKDHLAPQRPEWRGGIDARSLALGNIAVPVLGCSALQFNMLANLGGEQDLTQFARLGGISHVGVPMREQAFGELALGNVKSTLLAFQFQVENLFQNLWRALGGAEIRSFVQLTNSLLTQLGLMNPEREGRLKTMAHLRNCMHNNGVHNAPDFTFFLHVQLQTLDGPFEVDGRSEPVTLRRNQKVECSPMQLLGLCAAVLDVLMDVLGAAPVRAIAGPMPDLFGVANPPPGVP